MKSVAFHRAKCAHGVCVCVFSVCQCFFACVFFLCLYRSTALTGGARLFTIDQLCFSSAFFGIRETPNFNPQRICWKWSHQRACYIARVVCSVQEDTYTTKYSVHPTNTPIYPHIGDLCFQTLRPWLFALSAKLRKTSGRERGDVKRRGCKLMGNNKSFKPVFCLRHKEKNLRTCWELLVIFLGF